MAKENKWDKRDKKHHKARYGHTVSNKSIFLLQECAMKRAERIAKGGK